MTVTGLPDSEVMVFVSPAFIGSSFRTVASLSFEVEMVIVVSSFFSSPAWAV